MPVSIFKKWIPACAGMTVFSRTQSEYLTLVNLDQLNIKDQGFIRANRTGCAALTIGQL